MLYSSQAGTWPNVIANANIVPVVANERVYVASNQQLTIFGLGGKPFVPPAAAAAPPVETDMPPHAFTGVLEHADGPVLTLRTRTGTIARVDDSDALRREQTGVLVPGNAYTAQGTTYDSTGALHAQAVTRAKHPVENAGPLRVELRFTKFDDFLVTANCDQVRPIMNPAPYPEVGSADLRLVFFRNSVLWVGRKLIGFSNRSRPLIVSLPHRYLTRDSFR